MAVGVNIYVNDNTFAEDPIVGAEVGIFNGTTLDLLAIATTNGSGLATFMLAGSVPGTAYEVRIYKQNWAFTNPYQIMVIDDGVTLNAFQLLGLPKSFGIPMDARVCRCSGQFVNYSNIGIANKTIRIMNAMETGFQKPKIVDQNLVSASSMAFKTDAEGWLTVDLHRGAEYYIMYAGEDETVWNFTVPDRANANLIDLMFPKPVILVWNVTDLPSTALGMIVDEDKTVRYVLTFSDYQDRTEGTLHWLQVTISDPTVISLAMTDGVLEIKAKAAGVSTITLSAIEGLYPLRIPDNVITVPVITVTVT
jgi:hypothetical protein